MEPKRILSNSNRSKYVFLKVSLTYIWPSNLKISFLFNSLVMLQTKTQFSIVIILCRYSLERSDALSYFITSQCFETAFICKQYLIKKIFFILFLKSILITFQRAPSHWYFYVFQLKVQLHKPIENNLCAQLTCLFQLSIFQYIQTKLYYHVFI